MTILYNYLTPLNRIVLDTMEKCKLLNYTYTEAIEHVSTDAFCIYLVRELAKLSYNVEHAEVREYVDKLTDYASIKVGFSK